MFRTNYHSTVNMLYFDYFGIITVQFRCTGVISHLHLRAQALSTAVYLNQAEVEIEKEEVSVFGNCCSSCGANSLVQVLVR